MKHMMINDYVITGIYKTDHIMTDCQTTLCVATTKLSSDVSLSVMDEIIRNFVQEEKNGEWIKSVLLGEYLKKKYIPPCFVRALTRKDPDSRERFAEL